MNRLAALIPIFVIAALIVVFFFVIPAWRERSESPGTLPPADDLPPPPTAVIEGELEHHFGTIEFSGRVTLHHTFTLRSADDRTLKMGIDDTSCTCVTGELSRAMLAPGESVDVQVSLMIGKPGHIVHKVFVNASGALVILKVSVIVTERAEEVNEADETPEQE
jgi:hypothetical protein